MAIFLLLASCGADLEEAAEQALDEGGNEVELDDVQEQDDGEGGEPDQVVEAGSARGDFVEGWPNEFTLPEGAVILTSLAIDEEDTMGYATTFSGPTESIDAYLDHFRALAPVSNEVQAGDSLRAIEWGTEEQPIGQVSLTIDGEEFSGLITVFAAN